MTRVMSQRTAAVSIAPSLLILMDRAVSGGICGTSPEYHSYHLVGVPVDHDIRIVCCEDQLSPCFEDLISRTTFMMIRLFISSSG